MSKVIKILRPGQSPDMQCQRGDFFVLEAPTGRCAVGTWDGQKALSLRDPVDNLALAVSVAVAAAMAK